METLSLEQRAAVESGAAQTLVIAGPGSGKTGTLIARLARNTDLRRAVVIAFTNAAADEIRARLAATLEDDRRIGYIGTLHGFCLRLLQMWGARIGLPKLLNVLSEEEADAFLAETADRLAYRGGKMALKAACRAGPWVLKGELSEPAVVAFQYFQEMLKAGQLSYDLLLFMVQRLCSSLEPAGFQESFADLYVDEFQDASALDRFIYEQLPFRTRFFVGDPDQAIFGFRGGDVRNILALAHDPAWNTLRLENNFRCAGDICAAANELIEHNGTRYRKQTRSVVPDAGKVELWKNIPTAEREFKILAEDLRHTLATTPHGQVAILLRTNRLVNWFTDGLAKEDLAALQEPAKFAASDWPTCRRLVNLLANPDNDFLAYRFIADTRSTKAANEIRLKAMQERKTINRAFLHMPNAELGHVLPFLVRAGIGNLSMGMVAEAIEHADSVADLTIRLAEAETLDPVEAAVNNLVTVTTIHKAKGREWHTVYLPAWEEGNFPIKATEDVEEERRLAFVAVTRARKRVVISNALSRRPAWGAEAVELKASRFLREL